MASLSVETRINLQSYHEEKRTNVKAGMTTDNTGPTQVFMPTGITPLMQACQQGKEVIVRQLIHKDSSTVNQVDRTGKTCLHYCAENTNLSCIDQLLAINPSLIAATDEEGYTALHLATIAGNRTVVRYLLSHGADVHATDAEEHTVVHWATVCGEVEMLDLLMDAGVDPSTPDIHGAYPIHYAAQMCGPNSELGHEIHIGLQVLQKLLQRGVSVSVKDHDGRQPLLWAASAEMRSSHVYCPSGSADAILALINAGADVAAEDKDGLTALHCAASRGHLDCLDVLITLCNAEVDTLDSNGCTPIFYSTTLGHVDCTDLLLKHGAEPNRQDRKGRTPAHCGAAKGQLETLKMLHGQGADMWKRNIKGDLPLHEACQSGRKDLILWLLSLQPDIVSTPNNDGRTPLHIAAITNNIELCKILMDNKAAVNPIMRNSKGQLLTPVDAAVARGHRGCAKYLQLHGGLPALKLTDKRALQLAMQKALEQGPVIGHSGATPSDRTGEVTPSTKNISPTALSPIDGLSAEDGQGLPNQSANSPLPVDAHSQTNAKPLLKDAQFGSDVNLSHRSKGKGSDSSSEYSSNDEEGGGSKPGGKRKSRKGRRSKSLSAMNRNKLGINNLNGEDTYSDNNRSQEEGNRDGDPEKKRKARLKREERVLKRLNGEEVSESGDSTESDSDGSEEEENKDETKLSNKTATIKRKKGKSKKVAQPQSRKDVVRRVLSGGPRKVEAMEQNLKKKRTNDPLTEMSITRAMQSTLRKYALERRLFQQLLDLKRMQIRNSRANEHVMIKHLVDEYNKEGNMLGLKDYAGPYNFASYEKHLYDQLRFLQQTQGNKVPKFTGYDDVTRLNRALRKANIPDFTTTLDDKEKNSQSCNHTTHRCHHAIHAYTGVPCAAYLAQYRKNLKDGKIPSVNLPKISSPGTNRNENSDRKGDIGSFDSRKPLKVELQHGKAKQQISLPTNFLDKSQKYQLTVSIQMKDENIDKLRFVKFARSNSLKPSKILHPEELNIATEAEKLVQSQASTDSDKPSSAHSAPETSQASDNTTAPTKDNHSAPIDGTRTKPEVKQPLKPPPKNKVPPRNVAAKPASSIVLRKPTTHTTVGKNGLQKIHGKATIGKSIPGKSIPGKSIPGKTVPGKSVPGKPDAGNAAAQNTKAEPPKPK